MNFKQERLIITACFPSSIRC